MTDSFGWSYNNENLEYSGYPVVSANENEIVVLAPNISSFGSYTLQSNKELVFIPSLWAMKNIRTHLEEGALQSDRGVAFYALIKSLGANLYALVFSNDSSFSLDDGKLDEMMVSSGDELVLGSQFPAEHEGDHKIVGFGRNVIIFENKNGNGAETTPSVEIVGDYLGQLKQMFKVSENGDTPIQIRAKESIKIGSQISIPNGESPWFDQRFVGTHTVTDFGFINNFENFIDGNPDDIEHTTFWVEVETSKNAPAETVHTNYVDDVKHYKGVNSIYSIVKGSVNVLNDKRRVYISPVPKDVVGFSKGSYVQPISKLPVDASESIGLDAYTTLGGLVELAHEYIDGNDINEGWKAGGTKISVMPPVPKFIRLAIDLRVDPSTSVDGVKGVVQSSIMTYVNGLKTGEDVIVSAMVAICSKITGIKEVKISSDEIYDNKIVLAEDQKAIVKQEDIFIK